MTRIRLIQGNLRAWHMPIVPATGQRYRLNLISAVSARGQMRFMTDATFLQTASACLICIYKQAPTMTCSRTHRNADHTKKIINSAVGG